MSEEIEPLLDGEFSYRTETSNGGEMEPERTFEEEFALVEFSGEMSDLPEHFKRNVSVQKAERFEEGDILQLKDGFVSKFRGDFTSFHVTAHDSRKKWEMDLNEMDEQSKIYCPLCGNVVWSQGQRQDFVSCDDCQVYFDIYQKGEQMMFELGP